MDTNAIAVLIHVLSQKQAGADSTNTILIAGMFITAIAPTLAAIAAFFSARSARDNSADTKTMATATAASMEKVHVAVNSERTAMVAELKLSREDNLNISKKLATLEEYVRERLDRESRTAPPAVAAAVVPGPDPVSSSSGHPIVGVIMEALRSYEQKQGGATRSRSRRPKQA